MSQEIISEGETGGVILLKLNSNFTELYNAAIPNGTRFNITTPASAAQDSFAGENFVFTNQSTNGQYSARFVAVIKTGNLSSGSNDIADTLIGRYQNISNGSAWVRWDVVTSPLNPASGLPGAPPNPQSFAMVARETNPQNRHGDVPWAAETRRFVNATCGEQMVAETQDFSNLLGSGVRIGYNISYGYVISRSPFTNSDQQRHAQFSNGILINPNTIAPGGAGIFGMGYRDFPVAVAIANGGTGYTADDILTFTTGLSQSANDNTQVRVRAVGPGGVITSVEIWYAGSYQQPFASTIGASGGTGVGAQFTYTLSNEVPESARAFLGVGGTWRYALDAAPWTTAQSVTGGGRFLGGMIRAPSASRVVVARNAADSADIVGLSTNASDQWLLAERIVTPWQQWTPTITPFSGAFTTLTVDVGQTRFMRINGMVKARVALTITSIGTAGGGFQISLPPGLTPTQSVFGVGQNRNASAMLVGVWNGSVVRFTRDGAVNPLVNGNEYIFDIEYEVAG